jgi:hypothetical protein
MITQFFMVPSQTLYKRLVDFDELNYSYRKMQDSDIRGGTTFAQQISGSCRTYPNAEADRQEILGEESIRRPAKAGRRCWAG